jgi:hypothetical protein
MRQRAGVSAEVFDKLVAFAEAGARHFILAVASRDEPNRRRIALELVGRVLPQLRGGLIPTKCA